MMWEGGHYRKDPNNPPPTQGNFFAPQDVKNKYRYNGKEFIEDFDIGLYDYGARWYDPRIGRFMGVDPIAEKYAYVTTFNYAENEPVAHIDLWGLQKWDIIYNRRDKAYLKGEMTREEYYEDLHATDAIGPLALAVAFGPETALEEVGIYIFESITGVPVFNDPSDFVKAGSKKVGKEVAEGSTKLVSKAEKRAAKLSKVSREGKDFTKAGKEAVIDLNKAKNKGKVICENCGVNTLPATKSQKGITPSKLERQVDHIKPKSKGGSGTPDNGQVLCRDCNIKKSDK